MNRNQWSISSEYARSMTRAIRLTPRDMVLAVLLALVGGVTYAAPLFPAALDATIVRVIDGDTIDVRLDGRQERVRLIGVDTPETVHPEIGVEPWGPEASAFTKDLPGRGCGSSSTSRSAIGTDGSLRMCTFPMVAC